MILSSVCSILLYCVSVFFFKQKTAYEMRISDWSSDVCSSDLDRAALEPEFGQALRRLGRQHLVGDQRRRNARPYREEQRRGREQPQRDIPAMILRPRMELRPRAPREQVRPRAAGEPADQREACDQKQRAAALKVKIGRAQA